MKIMNKVERTLIIIIKQNKTKNTLFGAAKFNFRERKDVCPFLTQMQEHMLEDCCCKYCDQTFTSRTEKLSHMKTCASKTK